MVAKIKMRSQNEGKYWEDTGKEGFLRYKFEPTLEVRKAEIKKITNQRSILKVVMEIIE